MKGKITFGILIFILIFSLHSPVMASETEPNSQPPEVEEEINSILSLIKPSMSDVEKALVVHEYFLLNYSYDYTYDPVYEGKSAESYTAYGIMANKRGACNAYTEAYKYIMERLGIPCIRVISTAMDHAWNMISIDGEWYHVDVTHDDSNEPGNGHHMNFLRSDKGIAETGHYGWDGGVAASSTKYDNAFWINVLSYIYYIDGYFYYVDSGHITPRFQNGFTIIDSSKSPDNGFIKRYSFETNTHKTVYTVSAQTYTYKTKDRPYQNRWKGSNTRIATDNGRLYYNTNNKIYSINPEGKDNKLVCTVSLADFPLSSTTGIAYIKGIEIKNGTIFYKNSEDGDIYQAMVLPTALSTYTITAGAGTGGYISPSGSIELLQNKSRTFTITAKAGCTISDVLIDGKSIGAVEKYSFNNVSADHSIQVVFDVAGGEWQVIRMEEEFNEVYSFSEGFAVVERDQKYGIINTLGRLVIPFTNGYESISSYSNGLARVCKNGKTGCINTSGALVVPCIYDVIGNFQDGMAEVLKGGKFGFINTSGKLVIPCIYENIRSFINGVAWGFKNGESVFFDRAGNVVPTPANENDYFYLTDLTMICEGDKWGYADATGKTVVPCIYTYIGEFNDGLAYVYQNGKYGYVNTSGKVIIPIIYDMAGNFSDGLAYVSKNGRYGYIDKSAELVVPCIYEEAADFREGIAPVVLDGKWALLKKILPGDKEF
jgi:hypothetical protein